MDALRLPTSDAPRVSVVVLTQRDPAMLARCLSAVATSGDATAYELILVLNGSSEDVRTFVQQFVRGARVVDSVVNLGFGGGNNYAASLARGEYLLLLNDDAVPERSWLDALVATADAHPDAGAVGSRILFPDGRLQEAGSVIWADGSTDAVGRFEDGARAWPYRRRTDYVSFCSILIRRTAWDAVGGLDPRYFPAYYEDVDFCLGLRAAGRTVLYEPASVVKHMESQSTPGHYKLFLFGRNLAQLQAKWSVPLPGRLDKTTSPLADAVRAARGTSSSVLLIDERLPAPSMGAGYGRTYELIRRLDSARYAVIVYASEDPVGDPWPLGRIGVEALSTPPEDFVARLETERGRYDVVVISRPKNWAAFADAVRRTQPNATVIYDAEALFHIRSERHAALATGVAREESLRVARETKELETRIAREADALVCVSDSEEALLREMGARVVYRIPPVVADIAPTEAAFAERRDLLYVASWLAGPDSPNVDGLRWFVHDVAPLVAKELPWFRLVVTGGSPPHEVRTLAGPNVDLVGFVPDVREAYAQARAVISPMRFGAGVKIKTVEALQHAVPIVATTVGAESIRLHRGDEIDVADDPAEFAARCVRLLSDPAYWERQRAAILELQDTWRAEAGLSWSDVLDAIGTKERAHATG